MSFKATTSSDTQNLLVLCDSLTEANVFCQVVEHLTDLKATYSPLAPDNDVFIIRIEGNETHMIRSFCDLWTQLIETGKLHPEHGA